MARERLSDFGKHCEVASKALTEAAEEIYAAPVNSSAKNFEERYDTRPRNVRTKTIHNGAHYVLEWSVRLVEVF